MIFANFLYGSEISEVDLKSKVGRFVSGVKSFWFQVVTWSRLLVVLASSGVGLADWGDSQVYWCWQIGSYVYV